MTIAVTGATGFLGSALTTELVKSRQAVRLLAPDEKKAHRQFGDAVTIVAGEITNRAQVEQVIDGATTIYHLAGASIILASRQNGIPRRTSKAHVSCSKRVGDRPGCGALCMSVPLETSLPSCPV